MGAWIEILSPPYGRGLKMVAPFVGAWIEIVAMRNHVADPVAPFVGAWIEILYGIYNVSTR